MKNRHFKLLYILATFILFLSYPIRSQACNDKLLEERLEKLGYPKKIRNNFDLLAFIEDEFGLDAAEFIQEKNVFFKAAGVIDIQTLDWFQDQRMKNKQILSNYVYAIDSQKSIPFYIYSLIANFNGTSGKSIPVFTTKSKLDSFSHAMTRKEEIIKIIKSIKKIDDIQADIFYKKITEYYMSDELHPITLRNISSKNTTPIVHVTGFEKTTEQGLVTPDKKILSEMKFVQEVVHLGLPIKTTLKLDVCLKGCKSYPLSLKKSDVIDLINESEIDYLTQAIESEFLDNALSEYKRMQSSFQGKLLGYYGEKVKFIDKYTYFDGRKASGEAAELNTSDGALGIDKDALLGEAGGLPIYDIVMSDMQSHLPFGKISSFMKYEDGIYNEVTLGSSNSSKLADGTYIFIIPQGFPSKILAFNISHATTNGYGHTSISRGRPVHFAGEVKFNSGILIEWSNSSGHYRVPSNSISYLPDLSKFFPKSHYQAVGD